MSLIYMTTTTSQSVLANGIIPLTTISRRKGCSIQYGTNGVILTKPGYYKVSGTVTFTVPVAGNVTIDLYKSGVAVPGITASTTAAVGDIYTLPFDGVVRVLCCEGQGALQLINTGVAIDITNVSLTVDMIS